MNSKLSLNLIAWLEMLLHVNYSCWCLAAVVQMLSLMSISTELSSSSVKLACTFFTLEYNVTTTNPYMFAQNRKCKLTVIKDLAKEETISKY